MATFFGDFQEALVEWELMHRQKAQNAYVSMNRLVDFCNECSQIPPREGDLAKLGHVVKSSSWCQMDHKSRRSFLRKNLNGSMVWGVTLYLAPEPCDKDFDFGPGIVPDHLGC